MAVANLGGHEVNKGRVEDWSVVLYLSFELENSLFRQHRRQAIPTCLCSLCN